MAKIWFTSDTHSYVYDENYIRPGKAEMGYALLSSRFGRGDLIIDGGDVLQGSPLIRFEMKSGRRPFLAAEAFNAAGLGIYVPGNHDFNFGRTVLEDFLSSLDAEKIAANVVDRQGTLGLRQWTTRTLTDGTKVFVTGVVTDYVNVWESKENLEDLEITDCVKAAASMMELSKSLDVDFRILVYHGGFDDNEEGKTRENRGNELLELGYDILLTAHQHMVIEPETRNGTLVLQTGSKAMKAAEITLERGKAPSARLVSASEDFPIDDTMARVLEKNDLHGQLERFLSERIGTVAGSLSDKGKLESAMHGSSLADFINDIQIGSTGAEISACSLFNEPVTLSGDVTMGGLLSAYPFANTLVVLDILAADLKDAMERSASYLERRQDGSFAISRSFLEPKEEHYNYDYYRGLSYTFDLSRPIGRRVTRMDFGGDDLLRHRTRTIRMVVNSYRATGTGGYDAYRKAKVIYRGEKDVQDLLIDFFEQRSPVNVPVPTDFIAL